MSNKWSGRKFSLPNRSQALDICSYGSRVRWILQTIEHVINNAIVSVTIGLDQQKG